MQTQTRDEVVRQIQAQSKSLRKFGIMRLGLFGSFARNEQRMGSDVDLIAEFAPGAKTFRNFMGAITLLENSLQREVELVTPESLSPYLGPRILKETLYVTLTD